MRLEQLLTELYPEQAQTLLAELQTLIPEEKIILPFQQKKDWYKTQQLYVVYPDSFEIKTEANLHTLTKSIGYIKELGCTGIHILPFFESPLIDQGYDVSDYEAVRPNLGGNEAFATFLQSAHEQNMAVFIDIILNHASDQHPWFQSAISGNEFFRQFYITQKTKPRLVNLSKDEFGLWAEYQLETGTIRSRVIFPDESVELPHWFQAKDGYWYYHTFYPAQPDLNWENPEVFHTLAEIIMNWAKKGVNFRLDAIPFLGKQIGKGIIESGGRTHKIIEALHLILKEVAPHSVFLVEACQPQNITIEYFGRQTPQAEYAYSFRLMQGMWAALLGKSQKHIWHSLEGMDKIPEWGQWVTFLRNHDELTLEFADEDVRLLLYTALQARGLPFRAGYGVAGRTANFLQDPQHVLTAYLLLASLPGVPAIVYGDEIGKHNDLDFMEKQTALRRVITGKEGLQNDARDANRGAIAARDASKLNALHMYLAFSKIFQVRRRFPLIATTLPEPIMGLPDDIWGAKYRLSQGSLQMYINLGEDSFHTHVPVNATTELRINDSDIQDGSLSLPASSGIWIIVPDSAPVCLLE